MIVLTASPFALKYCERFRRDFRNTLTDAERNASPDENYHAKMAELEVGRFLHMKWSVLESLLNSASHFDVVAPNGLRGDVKVSMHETGNTLFWPRDKWEEFDYREFDWLGFCNTHKLPIIEFRGFVSKAEFKARHQIAGPDHHLKERTPYWPSLLRDPASLLELPPPHPRGHESYLNVHHCHCGAYGTIATMTGPVEKWVWQCNRHALAKQVEQREGDTSVK